MDKDHENELVAEANAAEDELQNALDATPTEGRAESAPATVVIGPQCSQVK